MTNIEWGPAIAVDGKRPGWIKDEEAMLAVWSGGAISWPDGWDAKRLSEDAQWHRIDAVKLPADHPHYRQPVPIDWSGELEAYNVDGRVVPAKFMCHASGGTADVRFDGKDYNALKPAGYIGDGWRIRNVTPQPTPQADTKPDVTARAPCMTISEVREMVAKGEDAVIATMLERDYALPEPVDPDLIEAREIVAKCCKWFSNTADQRLMVPSILDGSWDEAKAGLVQATLAAIKRGRELALAGETGK